MDSVPGRIPQWVTVDVDTADTHGTLNTEVVGKIPNWLKGCLYRNGAGVYYVKNTHIRHFFDGFSVMHKFSIEDGQVKYSSSLLDTHTLNNAPRYQKDHSHADRSSECFWTLVKIIFKGSQSYFAQLPAERTDNTSVNIVEFCDSLYALTETATINKIDSDSLRTLEMIDLTKVISIHTGTAHPHFNKNGDMYTYGTNFDSRKAYNIVRVPRTKGQGEKEEPMSKAEILASAPSRWQTNISYNHSFGMSENYFVVLDQPVAFNTKKFQISHVDMQGVAGTLLLRKGETVPCDMNLISLRHTKATAMMDFDTPNIITLTPDFLMPEKITMELPRINYGLCAGRKYRYAYGTSVFSDYYRLVKVDLEKRSVKEWRLTQYYLPGEPIFVPSPGGTEEDDGVILSPVLCETLEEPSFLLILDARTFTELARAYIPRDVKMSMTFHGSFCTQKSSRGEPEVVDIHL